MQVGSLNANGCCSQLYQSSADAANWVVKNGKIAGNYIADGFKKVAVWAKDFFAKAGVYLTKAYQFVKCQFGEGYKLAKDFSQKNPRVLAALAGAFAVGSAITALFCRCCKKNPEITAASNAGNRPAVNAN